MKRRISRAIFASLAALSVLLALLSPVGGLIAMAIFFTMSLRMSRGYRGRVLFLRRFGTDNPPNYRLSQLISALCHHGYEVITLADNHIDRDSSSVRILSGPIALIINVFLSIVVITPIILLFIFMVTKFNLLFHSIFLFTSAWMMTVVIVIYLLTPNPKYTNLYTLYFFIQRRTADWLTLIFPRNTIDLSDATMQQIANVSSKKLKKKWQIGFNIIIASDKNWNIIVEQFIVNCDKVIIDLTFISNNIMQEISILSRVKNSNKIIWMYAENSLLDISLYDHGYFVRGIYFRGKCNILTYPTNHERQYNSDDAVYSTINPRYVDLSRKLIGAVKATAE